MRRQLDGQKLIDFFLQNGYSLVEKPVLADFIVLVTCAFNNTTENHAIKQVRELSKLPGKLVVVGCLPVINKKRLRKHFKGPIVETLKLGDVDKLFAPETSFAKIEDPVDFDRFYSKSNYAFQNRTLMDHFKKILPPFSNTSVRARLPFLLRVGGGCGGSCSYCVIKKAIGNLKSRPLQECVSNFKAGLARGYKFFFLVADDIGGYGLDIGTDFPQLLRSLLAVKGDYVIEVHELGPKWVIKYEKELRGIVRNPAIKYLEVVFQSGNSRILDLMGRSLDMQKLKRILRDFKRLNPGLLFGTHMIAGFPTETRPEFYDSLNLAEQAGFDIGLLYLYNDRVGAKSARIRPKVSEKEKQERFALAESFFRERDYTTFSTNYLWDIDKASGFVFFNKRMEEYPAWRCRTHKIEPVVSGDNGKRMQSRLL